MDWDRLITVEQMEAATNELLETGKKVGADSWQQRVKNQTPHCGFGEAGTCCRICSMGPCRITPKAPRGICGCDVHGIVGRNYLRFTAGGAATHSDHGRQICHTLYQAKEGGSYQVKDPEKLKKIAAEWGIETEGKDIYDLAHEVAETGLLEYGKPFGVQRYLKRAPEHTQKLWHDAGIEPRAIDREVSQSLHMTHMGCSSLPEALIKQSLRAGLSDGWGGSMMGTEFSDILFGTPRPVDTTANIGVMEKDMVNIIVHGHDPSLSEMIVMYSQDPEMVALAKSVGAKGINIAGVCCTGNDDKTRGTATLRRPVRTHQRRRHHGSAARSGSFRLRTRLSDRFDRRHPPLPDGTGSRTHRPINNTTPKISCQCRISPDRRSLWDQAPIRLHEPVRSRRNRPPPLQTDTDSPIA